MNKESMQDRIDLLLTDPRFVGRVTQYPNGSLLFDGMSNPQERGVPPVEDPSLDQRRAEIGRAIQIEKEFRAALSGE